MIFRHSSLRRRVMLVAAVPTMIAVLTLTAFHMFQRWDSVRSENESIARLVMEELAAAAEYPLISGNYDLLNSPIDTALQQPAIIAIEIRDTQNRQLLEFQADTYSQVPGEDVRVLTYDIIREVQELDEFSEFEEAEEDTRDSSSENQAEIQTLAVIYLSMTDTFTRDRELSILWQSALAGLIVVIIAALIGRVLAFNIITALEKLSVFFSQLAAGKVSVRISVDDGAEVGRLQVHANQLASSLQQAEVDQKNYTEQLVAEQEKTQRASRAKSEFLAMMSHEFRTPLNGAIGMLQLLDRNISEEEFSDYKGMAEQSLTHLTQLLEDVLVIVDTEKNKLQVLFAEHHIEDILSNLMTSFSTTAMNRGLSLVVDYDKELKKQSIRTDPSLVRQVVRHLVDNALKFTEEGVVIVELKLARFNDQDCLSIQVSDTGIGIPDDKKQKVLEAFSQVNSSFNRRYDGVGLGLSISYHISRMLGGRLLLQDNPSGGTRVVVELPIELAHTPTPVIKQQPRARHVLIVEDNPVNMKVAEKMLGKSFDAMEIDKVESGEACLKNVNEIRYDLILMDCQMPGLDGFETSRELRNRGVETPIVACTANNTDHIYQKCIDSGMNDYIAKPLKVDKIKKTLERWL